MLDIKITAHKTLVIREYELVLSAIRAQGAGGQHVNKVSTAIHLQFDVKHASFSQFYKDKILAYRDSRISQEGVITIKAQSFRSQEKNKADALERLSALITEACKEQKTRKATKPSRNSQRKRMDKKTNHGQKKLMRGRVDF